MNPACDRDLVLTRWQEGHAAADIARAACIAEHSVYNLVSKARGQGDPRAVSRREAGKARTRAAREAVAAIVKARPGLSAREAAKAADVPERLAVRVLCEARRDGAAPRPILRKARATTIALNWWAAGESVAAIMEEAGLSRAQVQQAIARARKAGDARAERRENRSPAQLAAFRDWLRETLTREPWRSAQEIAAVTGDDVHYLQVLAHRLRRAGRVPAFCRVRPKDAKPLTAPKGALP